MIVSALSILPKADSDQRKLEIRFFANSTGGETLAHIHFAVEAYE